MPVQTRSKSRRLALYSPIPGHDFLLFLPVEMIHEIRGHFSHISDHIRFSQTCTFLRAFYYSENAEDAETLEAYWKGLCYASCIGIPKGNTDTWHQIAMIGRDASKIPELDHSRCSKAKTSEEVQDNNMILTLCPLLTIRPTRVVDIDWEETLASGRRAVYVEANSGDRVPVSSVKHVAYRFATTPPVQEVQLLQSYSDDGTLKWETCCFNPTGVTVLDMMIASCERPSNPVHICGQVLRFAGFMRKTNVTAGCSTVRMWLTHSDL